MRGAEGTGGGDAGEGGADGEGEGGGGGFPFVSTQNGLLVTAHKLHAAEAPSSLPSQE